MLKSMTGFGSASLETADFAVSVEVKSLNSKSLDLNLRTPRNLNDKEFEIRNLVSQSLERGKVSLNVEITYKVLKPKLKVNQALVKAYYDDLLNTAFVLGAPTQDIFKMALALPDAYTSEGVNENNEQDWLYIQDTIQQAIIACTQFRLDEGAQLEKDITNNIIQIATLLEQVKLADPVRIANLRARLKKQVEELLEDKTYDQNRFEQELVYYIEKYDINEEKVRLTSHLNYFIQTIKSPEANGKKLGFIAQEIGREINTIGSKANDANMQQLVVQMKEELEQIKEQTLNIL